MFILLAQEAPTGDQAIGWAERMSKGGVPVICLCVAIAAVLGCVLLFRKVLEKEREKTELEKTYRTDLEDQRKQERVEADKRLADERQASKDRATEVDKLMRERLQAEKESDATLAQAVRVIDANSKLLERVDRKLGG